MMKQIKLLALAATLAVINLAPAVAQTADTNDVAQTLAVQCNYSTNQLAGLRAEYRRYTNAVQVAAGTNAVALPTFVDWHREVVRRMAADMANSYDRQRREQEAAKAEFLQVRDRWADLSEAQRQRVMEALK